MANDQNRVFIEVTNGLVLGSEEVLSGKYKGLKELAAANKNKDLMFISFILKHEGGNANGDYFTRDELEQGWRTYVGKPITWEHKEPFIGHITDAMLIKSEEDENQRWYIECAGVIWKARFPKQAEIIQDGALEGEVRMSMETYFADAVYALGDNMEEVFTRKEAPYLAAFKGRKYNGKPVYRVLIGCHGAGVGVVANPADEDAVFLSVANDNKTNTTNDNNTLVIDESANSAHMLIPDLDKYLTANLDKYTKEEVLDVSDEKNNLLDEPTVGNDTENISEAEDKNEDVSVETEVTEAAEEISNNEVEGSKELESDAAEEEVIEAAEEDEKDEKDLIEASLVVDFLNRRLRSEAFESVFYGLKNAILSHMYSLADEKVEKADFENAVNEEILSFIGILSELLPGILNDWGVLVEASVSKEVSKELITAKSTIKEVKAELVEVKEEYAVLKAQVESEKEEIKKDVLAKERLNELIQAGVELSDSSKNKWLVRFRDMDKETFADLKEILTDGITEAAEDVTEEAVGDVDLVTETKDENIAKARVLNLEGTKDYSKQRLNKFEKMWQTGLKG